MTAPCSGRVSCGDARLQDTGRPRARPHARAPPSGTAEADCPRPHTKALRAAPRSRRARFTLPSVQLCQVIRRVERRAVSPDLQMQMGAGCIAGLTDTGNLAAAADLFSHLDGNTAAMRVQRRKSVRMIDDQVLPVARLSVSRTVPSAYASIVRALISRYVHAVVKSRSPVRRTSAAHRRTM